MKTNLPGELVAVVIFVSVGRTGAIGLAFVFLLKSIAAEVIFFFEKKPILAAEEIRGGKSRGTATNDDDVRFARGLRANKCVAIAKSVAEFEMFTVNERSGVGIRIGSGEKRLIDGTAGNDGAHNNKFDEITAR